MHGYTHRESMFHTPTDQNKVSKSACMSVNVPSKQALQSIAAHLLEF